MCFLYQILVKKAKCQAASPIHHQSSGSFSWKNFIDRDLEMLCRRSKIHILLTEARAFWTSLLSFCLTHLTAHAAPLMHFGRPWTAQLREAGPRVEEGGGFGDQCEGFRPTRTIYTHLPASAFVFECWWIGRWGWIQFWCFLWCFLFSFATSQRGESSRNAVQLEALEALKLACAWEEVYGTQQLLPRGGFVWTEMM